MKALRSPDSPLRSGNTTDEPAGPILNESHLGITVEQTFTYTWRDVVLYNISVGAGPSDLSYVYEKDLKVIPTFAVIPGTATFGVTPAADHPDMPTDHIEGLRKDGTVQMDHKLSIRKPLKTDGTWQIRKVFSGLYDRGPGRGAKIIESVTGYDESGEEIFVNEIGSLNRFSGGFGRKPVPEPAFSMPSRDPDRVLHGVFPENAAILYRLTGDLYPIHVDPEAAGKARLPHPILHGLCSMGYACRLLIDTLLPGEPERVRSMENQFRAMVTPGEAFCLQIWENTEPAESEEASRSACYRLIAESDDRPIIDYGRMTWA